jgi:hypothetical protein
MDAIVKRLDALSMERPIKAVNTFPVESCSVCASPLHQAQNCLFMAVFSKMEQVNTFNNFQKQSTYPYSETYNPGWRNHPNISWKVPPPKFLMEAEPAYKSRRVSSYLPKSWTLGPASVIFLSSPHSTPNVINSVIRRVNERIHEDDWSSISDIRHSTMVNTQTISKLETQVGQLASHLGERNKGKLPSQPANNPKACTIGSAPNQEHVHAIVTLRSEKRVDNHVDEPEAVDEAVPAADLAGQEETKSDNKEKKDAEPSTITPI